jgi:outer membrane protein OmpA-like peptidoglycan-associated protein
MRRIPFVLFVSFVFSLSAFSQSRKEWLEYGDDAFKREDYASAAFFYLHVIDPKTTNAKDYTFPYDVKTWMAPLDSTKKDSGNTAPVDTAVNKDGFKKMTPEIRYQYVTHQVAESYRLARDYANAETWYAKSVQNHSSQFPNDVYYYGRCLMQNEKYADAQKVFESVTRDSTKTNTELYKYCIRGYLGCLLAIDSNSVKQKNISMLDSTVNQGSASFAPGFFGDDLTLLFTGGRKDGKVLNPKEENPLYRADLYTANKSGSGWETAKNLDVPINTPMNEGAGSLSINKDLFFFTRWNPLNPHECAIWVSKNINGKWLQPMKLGETVNVDGYRTKDPNLSFDGTKLYFASDRPGGKGKMDIWYVDMDENGTPGMAHNLGPKVNSSENEISPFYNFKTTTLYFSSDGHPGFGGYDIFKSFKSEDESDVDTLWSTPMNLKMPINSSKDDEYMVIQNDQRLAYFSSDRQVCKDCGNANANCLKIYQVDKEPLLFKLSGYVYDRETNKPIPNALLTFKDVDGNVDPFFATSDDKGFYSIDLREDFELYIKAQKNKYFGDAATVSTKGMVESKDLTQDFYLSRIPEGEIVIPGIEYDFDKATLRPESKKILDDLANFLTLNNQIYIQINSHTDCRGSDDYNLRLSKERAKSCVDYLIMKGIDPKRLLSEGYGETQPLEIKDDKGNVVTTLTCDYINGLKTKEEQEAAHQKNRRTAFVVVHEDELKGVKIKHH